MSNRQFVCTDLSLHMKLAICQIGHFGVKYSALLGIRNSSLFQIQAHVFNLSFEFIHMFSRHLIFLCNRSVHNNNMEN